MDELKTAMNMFVQGKRQLLTKDIAQAVNSLGDACRLMSDVTGIFSPESGDAHYFYGKALLEHTRLELPVFGQPTSGPNETKSGDEDEDDEEMEDDEEGDEEDDGKEKEDEEMNMDSDETTETEGEKSKEEPVTEEGAAVLSNGHKETGAPAEKPELPSSTLDPVADSEAKTECSATLPGNEIKDLEGKNENTAVQPTQSIDATDANGEEDLSTVSPGNVDDQKPSTSAGTSGADPDLIQNEEELTNLELAWEVLEVAKVAFVRLIELTADKLSEMVSGSESDKTEEEKKATLEKELKTYRNKLANVHLLLGEVATESEQYTQAVEDINTALAILSETEEYDSRHIAVGQFQLGIAYSFDKSYDSAIASFKKASELIKSRIENLQKLKAVNTTENENGGVTSGNGSTTEEKEKTEEEEEIEELMALLPELQEKIVDTLDAQKDAIKVSEEEKQEQEIIMRNSPVKNPNPPAINDISHLVKKRKKVEDLPPAPLGLDAEPPSKKVCTEADSSTPMCSNGGENDTVNGSSVTATTE